MITVSSISTKIIGLSNGVQIKVRPQLDIILNGTRIRADLVQTADRVSNYSNSPIHSFLYLLRP